MHPREDYTVEPLIGGNLVLLTPNNETALRFAAQNTVGASWFGRSMAVDVREVAHLVDFLSGKGFEIGGFGYGVQS